MTLQEAKDAVARKPYYGYADWDDMLKSLHSTHTSVYEMEERWKEVIELLKSEVKIISSSSVLSDSLLLSQETKKFVVWVNAKDEYRYDSTEDLWIKDGYKSRTTQELFDY